MDIKNTVDTLRGMYESKRRSRTYANDNLCEVEVEARIRPNNFYDILRYCMKQYKNSLRMHVCDEYIYVFYNEKNTTMRVNRTANTFIIKNRIENVHHGPFTCSFSMERLYNKEAFSAGKASNITLQDRRIKIRHIFERDGYEIHFTVANDVDAYIEIELIKDPDFAELEHDLEVISGEGIKPTAYIYELTQHVKEGMVIQKPIDLTKDNVRGVPFITKAGYVTKKLDGLRCFIMVHKKHVYEIDLRGNHRHLNKTSVQGTYVIDCEKTLNPKTFVYTYHGFDILRHPDTKDCGTLKYSDRIQLIPDKLSGIKFKKKESYKYTTYDELASVIQSAYEDKEIYDGVIIYDDIPYSIDAKNHHVYKYKFFNTVDVSTDGVNAFAMKGKIPVKIHGVKVKGFKRYKQRSIVECSYDVEDGNLVFIKERRDKDKPNSSRVVNNIIGMYKHNRNLSVSLMTGNADEPFFMRVLHNRMKSSILSGLKGSLLDIGSGQGGDLGKWMKNKSIKKVYACEPNVTNSAELIRRLMLFKGQTKVEVKQTSFEDGTFDKVNSITVLFMLNCVKPSGLCGFLLKAKSLLKDNGVIHIIYMDKDGLKNISTSMYSVEFVTKDSYMININNSMVLNHTEWCISESKLRSHARKIGMTFKYVDKLDYAFLSADERYLSSRYRYVTMTNQ